MLSDEKKAIEIRSAVIARQEEALATVQAALAVEDMKWVSVFGLGQKEEGPSLEDCKKNAILIRSLAAGSALIKRGLALRHSYVWSKMLRIPGLDDDTGKAKRGPKSALQKFVKNPVNQRYVFGDTAHEPMEYALGTDGAFLLLGRENDKTLRSFPLTDVEEIVVNPNFPDEIWAYKRKWVTPKSDGSEKAESRWYYTDSYTDKKATEIAGVKVDPGHTVIDLWVNRQSGWSLGVADALPAIMWSRTYTELMQYGKIVNDALATFVAKVKVKSKPGSDNVGLKMSKPGVGKVTTYGEGNDVDVFSTAGKTYDFNGIRPVAAQVASSLEVSIVHLLSDPGAAGSSYGSASNLDLPTKRAMVSRQNTWTAFLERVIRWGTGEDLNLAFPPLEEPDTYRETQGTALAWNSGLYHDDEIRPKMADTLGIVLKHPEAPEGVMTPNNENSLGRRDVDTDSSAADGVTPSTAAPDQGTSNRTGGADSTLGNDILDDQRTETLERQVAFLMEQIERLSESKRVIS